MRAAYAAAHRELPPMNVDIYEGGTGRYLGSILDSSSRVILPALGGDPRDIRDLLYGL